ncbi:MAG: SIMPL domain-containing protein, partial [Hyphomicrobiales bacterium]|nr:SIMPL domain-containing protein [Hyphomicrobiales bacterium]
PRVDGLLQTLKSEGVSIDSSRFDLGETPLSASNASKASAPLPPSSYTATTSYNLRIDKLDSLSEVITKLASSGLVEVHTASFHVEDERVPLDEARRNAVADARRQAETIADAAGVRLDGILSISDARVAPRVDGYADLPTRKYLQIIPPIWLQYNASIVITWRISQKP